METLNKTKEKKMENLIARDEAQDEALNREIDIVAFETGLHADDDRDEILEIIEEQKTF